MSQHDCQKLERLRAVEQRLRQVTRLQGEIAALLGAPAIANKAAEILRTTTICAAHGACEKAAVTQSKRGASDVQT